MKSFKEFIVENKKYAKTTPAGDPFSFLSQDKFIRKDRIVRKRGAVKQAAQNLGQAVSSQSEIDAAADAIRDMRDSGKMGKITPDVKQGVTDTKNKLFTKDLDPSVDTNKLIRDPKTGDTIANPVKDTTKKTAEKISRASTRGNIPKIEDEAKFSTKTNTVKSDQKPVDTTNKTTNKVNKITKNLTKPKKGQEIKYNRTIDKKLKSIEKTKTKPRTVVKQFTTQPKSKTDLKGIMQRGLERTGVVDPKPQKEVKGKLKPLTKTDLKNTRLKTNVVNKTPKGLKAVRGLSTLGRIAGGAFAVQDFLSTAKREKAMGRGKTAARLAGLSRALGGYVGGGIGATLGAGVASLPGGIAGGAAGYHYGSKLGDKVYQTGRDLVTGKKTFKQLRKDIGKGLNTTKQGLNKRWNQYIDYKD